MAEWFRHDGHDEPSPAAGTATTLEPRLVRSKAFALAPKAAFRAAEIADMLKSREEQEKAIHLLREDACADFDGAAVAAALQRLLAQRS